jgi:ABC-type branched-subunit amino acid transport system substrate-binding protein
MNAKRLIFGSAALALALVGTLTLSTSAQSTLDERLRIGFIGGSSSAANNRDVQLYQAAVLAVEELNNDDGVVAPDDTRYGFEIIYYEADTQTEVLDALSEAVDDEVIAVLGPNDPTLAQAISDEGTPDVPVLLGASAAPDGRYIYRLSADYATWAEAAADYLTQRHFDKIGMLTVNTDSAISAHDAFEAAVDGDVIVADISFDADRSDFSAEAQTIRDEGAEALFIWARNDQTEALLEALDDARWDGVIVFGGNDGAFLETTSADTGDVFGLANWSTVAYDAASQSFVVDYSARWGGVPSDDSAAYYDAVALIANAVDNSGARVSSIANWLSNTGELNGVQGMYDGSQTDTVRLLQWQDGTTIEAARFASGECQNCPAYFVEDTSDADADSSATFRIGLLTTDNSAQQAIEESIENSVNLAIREINDLGGVIDPDNTRYTFSLDVYTANTADDAASALQQAVDDGVQIMLGPDFNGLILSNLTDAEQNSILQFVSATNGQITQDESGDYVFQIRATDEALASAAADYLLNNRDLTRFVTVAANTDYGVDGISAFADVVTDSDNGDILMSLEHDVTETDMAALVDQIINADAEAVVVWTTQPAASALLAELHDRDWDGVFLYGYLTAAFISENAADGIELLGPVNWWSTADSWAAQDFSARFTDRYNSDPMPQSAAYYDAVYLLQQAISANGADITDIQSWLLEQASFIGAQGEYTPETFANGELTRSVLIIGANGGLVTELSRYNGDVCVAWCG